MHRELAQVWGRLAADPGCRAVVLTGAGRAFSAGGDLPRMVATQQDQAIQDEVFDEARRTVLGMIELPQPLDRGGQRTGGGTRCQPRALCDLAVASESAYLADPTSASVWCRPTVPPCCGRMMIGLMRAKEYVFTGERIPRPPRGSGCWSTGSFPPPTGSRVAVALAHPALRALRPEPSATPSG